MEKEYASPPRFAAVLLDSQFEHPASFDLSSVCYLLDVRDE